MLAILSLPNCAQSQFNELVSHYSHSSFKLRTDIYGCHRTDHAVFGQWINAELNQVSVCSAWDSAGVFFWFHVRDTQLSAIQLEPDHRLVSRDDVVEVLIDPNADRDSCWKSDDRIYHFNLLGTGKDDSGSDSCKSLPSWNGKANAEITLWGTLNDSNDRDMGYCAVVFIPWEDIGQVKPPNFLWVNLGIGDNGHFKDWCNLRPFRLPVGFRRLRLLP